MSSVSKVGLALSLVFGFLFLALIAELYYLLWWKKRIINCVDDKEDCNGPRRGEFMYMSCWTKPSFLGSKALEPQRLCSAARMADTQVYEPQSMSYPNQNNNIWFRQFGEDEIDDDDDDDDDDDSFDQTLNAGPPRFLFTIIEETKEDLESEDGGASRKVSLSRRYSDLVLTIETTPYLTPLASPTAYFTPPLTPSSNGFNPLFESSSDVEIRRIKSSPPPKFKFLKDAEEKLFRRQMIRNDEMGVHEIGEGEEETEMGIGNSPSDPFFLNDEENGYYITPAVARKIKGKEDMSSRVQFHGFSQCLSSSSSSQVLPVTASHTFV